MITTESLIQKQVQNKDTPGLGAEPSGFHVIELLPTGELHRLCMRDLVVGSGMVGAKLRDS